MAESEFTSRPSDVRVYALNQNTRFLVTRILCPNMVQARGNCTITTYRINEMSYKLFSILLTTICLSSCKTISHSAKEKETQAYKQHHNRPLYWSHFPWVIRINLGSARYNLLCRPVNKNILCLDYYNTQKWRALLPSVSESKKAFWSLPIY